VVGVGCNCLGYRETKKITGNDLPGRSDKHPAFLRERCRAGDGHGARACSSTTSVEVFREEPFVAAQRRYAISFFFLYDSRWGRAWS